MDAKYPADIAATVIIGQKVLPGSERQFESWQREMNSEVAKYPGFIAAEINPPTAVQSEWGVVFRFDSVANLQAWINSATRQEWINKGKKYFDGPGSQQVISGGARQTDSLVTVVVTHRVSPVDVEEFLAWQERLRVAETKFAGFRGTEVFHPVEGIQDEWTALYRYDNATDLDKWLISKERQELLAEGAAFSDFQSRTIDNSFGSWFAFGGDSKNAPPPSDFKTSIAVWFGLYPTVVLLTLLLSPLKMPLWQGLLIGNLFSSFTMSYVTMPHYVNPLLKRYLAPRPGDSMRTTNSWGFGITFAVLTAWTVVFYLVTTVFWHLP